jgi:transposase-like protein
MNIIQVYEKFPTHEDCLKHLEEARWHGKPICPYCKSTNVTPVPKELRHHCNNCNTSFRVTVQTIFHNTKLDLQKWFLAVSLILNAKKGMSARQLARDIQVNKDTAWYMGMRIRRAMNETPELLKGIVEADETYIGGNPRKFVKDPERKRGRGTTKTPVAGIAERGGKIKAKKMDNLSHKKLSSFITKRIDSQNTTLMTDEFPAYSPFGKKMKHKVINHKICYSNGDIHTNTIESFWALFKRGIIGQYHHISDNYLQKYLDEFCFRLNNRGSHDIFELTLSNCLGV